MAELAPEDGQRSDLYATIRSPLPKVDFAGLFELAGWSVRKCTWSDFELEIDFADLVLEADDPILLNGKVSDILTNVHRVADVLRGAGSSFVLECYSPDGTLLQEVKE